MPMEESSDQPHIAGGNAGISEKKQRGPNKKLKYGIPSRIFILEKHFDILTAYNSIYSQKQEPIPTNALSFTKELKVDLVMRNNKFYVDTGFLSQSKGRCYIPTKGLQEFIKNKRLGREKEAKSDLRRLISDKWFFSSVKTVLEYKSPSEEKSLIDALAYEINASSNLENNALKVFLDLMIFAEVLIKTPDGKYELVQQKPEQLIEHYDQLSLDLEQKKLHTNQKVCIEEKKDIDMNNLTHPINSINQQTPKISIQLVINIDQDTPSEKIRELINTIIQTISEG